jgi:hypothetical protein
MVSQNFQIAQLGKDFERVGPDVLVCRAKLEQTRLRGDSKV